MCFWFIIFHFIERDKWIAGFIGGDMGVSLTCFTLEKLDFIAEGIQ